MFILSYTTLLSNAPNLRQDNNWSYDQSISMDLQDNLMYWYWPWVGVLLAHSEVEVKMGAVDADGCCVDGHAWYLPRSLLVTCFTKYGTNVMMHLTKTSVPSLYNRSSYSLSNSTIAKLMSMFINTELYQKWGLPSDLFLSLQILCHHSPQYSAIIMIQTEFWCLHILLQWIEWGQCDLHYRS